MDIIFRVLSVVALALQVQFKTKGRFRAWVRMGTASFVAVILSSIRLLSSDIVSSTGMSWSFRCPELAITKLSCLKQWLNYSLFDGWKIFSLRVGRFVFLNKSQLSSAKFVISVTFSLSAVLGLAPKLSILIWRRTWGWRHAMHDAGLISTDLQKGYDHWSPTYLPKRC